MPQAGPVGGVFSAEAQLRSLSSLPSFRLVAPESLPSGARFPEGGGTFPSGNTPSSLTFVGAGVGFALVFSDRWLFDLFSFDLAHAVGRSHRVLSSIDGSIVELRPWTSFRFGVTLGGFGARWKHRRWMLELGAQPGLSILYTKAELAEGASSHELGATAISPLLSARVAGCRRLDPLERVCLFVAPSLYDMGFLSGGALGLRYEFGS